jgi:hypothetical protein
VKPHLSRTRAHANSPPSLRTYLAKSGKYPKTTRNKIRLISAELEYADKHNVPPKYLIGFLHQVGGSKRIQQMRRLRPRSEDRARTRKIGSEQEPREPRGRAPSAKWPRGRKRSKRKSASALRRKLRRAGP